MSNHSERTKRCYAALTVVVFAGGMSFLAPSCAWAHDDVALDDLTLKAKDGSTIVIPHVDFIDTNLNKDEIGAMLSADTPEADQRDLVKRFKADKVSAASIDILAKDGTKITLHDFAASDLDAGRVGELGLSGLEGSLTSDGSPVSIKSGTFLVEGLDMADMLKAVDDGAKGAQKGRIDHLNWSSIDITTSGSHGGAGKSTHITLASAEVHSGYSGDALTDGWTKITGLVVEPAPDSDEGKNLASFGYSKVELAVGVSANYKVEAKTFSLDNFTIDGAHMGAIGVKANFSNVSPGIFAADNDNRLQALFESGVVSLEVRLVNGGLFEKTLAYFAKEQKATPAALQQQWSELVGQMAPVFLGGNAGGLKAAKEVQTFIASPHNLTIAVKAKDGALMAADFMTISDPAAFVGKLDITAAANQ